MKVTFPKALEGKELDPGFGAYESLDPLMRTYLKNQIAVLHEAWLPEGRDGGLLRVLPGGTRMVRQKFFFDWALFVFGADYASSAGLIAAVLPALMAEVPGVFIVRLDGDDVTLHPALSGALELLGREDIYTITSKNCPALVAELSATGVGRVVSLGCDIQGAINLPAKVKIGLRGQSPVDLKTLDWLHPGAEISAYQAGEVYDAVITEQLGTDGCAALTLDPAYAYIWFWPNLSPDFFRRESILITVNHG